VVEALVNRYPELWLSRSLTTRPRRPTESEDAYVFVTRDEFERKITEGGFLEYAEFLGNFYGTPHPVAPEGRDIVLEIDVQGARQVLRSHPDALLIFLLAPSAEEQEARLRGRGDPPHKVLQRLQKAAAETDAGRELGAAVIVNTHVDSTVEDMWTVIEKARAGL
jgi:guanylate kinase